MGDEVNRLTHRLMSLLMIVAAFAGYVATEGLGAVPPQYHGKVLLAAMVLMGLSKSVREVITGDK
jgi:hypothetical protein